MDRNRFPGIDSRESIPPASCAEILKQSMGARNRLGIGLESIPGVLKSLKIPSLVGLYDIPVRISYTVSTTSPHDE